MNFQVFKLVLEKAEEPEVKLPASTGSSKKQEGSRKTSTSASFIMLKLLTVWITTNCGKFFKRWEYQTTLPISWETLHMGQEATARTSPETRTGSKLGKEFVKAIYCHLPCLTYMQSTSCKILGWMNHKLKSRLLGEISTTSNTQMIPPLWQKATRN